MSKHNRERKSIWKLGLHPKQTGVKLKGEHLRRAMEQRLAEMKVIAATRDRQEYHG